jgi:hypothetical protein
MYRKMPIFLTEESVHTTLSITHHTRKRPSTGPQITHGPQYPPWWVHWQHKHIVTQEKRKRKETNKRKLQQAIESQTMAKGNITWRRQVSDPLGKGNGSTHPRQTMLKWKAQTTNPKLEKPQRAPPPLHTCKLPWTNATPHGRKHAKHHMKQSSCNSSALTGQTGGQDRPAPGNYTGQTGAPLWSGRCLLGNCLSSKIARNHLETF